MFKGEMAHVSVLVTGGAGFVGGNLVRRLLTYDIQTVHIVDNLLSAERSNIPNDERIRFTHGSISDDKVLATIHDTYDYIFHLSTYHGNQSSIANPLADHDNNTLTSLKLLERVKDFKQLKKWVYSAAGCAVAEKTDQNAQATQEDAPISLDMDSPYSISKIIGEYYAVYYHERLGVPTVRARFQNVYGPREILGAGEWRGTPATVWRNVTPTFIFKSIQGQSLPIEGDGSAARDFIYVQDIVDGLLFCATKGASGDVYNLASGVETSILELATIINELTGNQAPIDFRPGRDWDHSGRRFGSTEKSKKELGFEAKISIRNGLAKTVEWTKQNITLIELSMRKHNEHLEAIEANS
jgi:nucleoside-diphosphate-sugar epimerase